MTRRIHPAEASPAGCPLSPNDAVRVHTCASPKGVIFGIDGAYASVRTSDTPSRIAGARVCGNRAATRVNLLKAGGKPNIEMRIFAKCGYLREFCKLRQPPANRRATFTRQRSLVRNQHRPLLRPIPKRKPGIHGL